jgi:hypothetical protein
VRRVNQAAAPRPKQVTTAFGLQLGAAGSLLICAVLFAVGAIYYNGLISDAAAATGADPDDVSAERIGNLVTTLVVGVPTLLLGGWLLGTAFGLRRGSNTARIMSAIGLAAPLVVGVLYCCGLGAFAGILGVAFSDGGFDDSGYDDGDFSEFDYDGSSPFYDKLDNSDSGFSAVVSGLGGVFGLFATMLALAAGILLFVGPARRYFRPDKYPPGFPIAGYPVYGFPQAYGYQAYPFPAPAYGPYAPGYAAAPPVPVHGPYPPGYGFYDPAMPPPEFPPPVPSYPFPPPAASEPPTPVPEPPASSEPTDKPADKLTDKSADNPPTA